ncbi:DUF2059 domain-containing protein [Maricaulis sp. CAU 1757]
MFRFLRGATLAVALAGGLAAAPVVADDRRELAERMAEQVGAAGLAMDMVDLMVPVMRQQILAADPTLTSDQLDDLVGILVEEFQASEPELRDGIIGVYADSFTEAELRAAVEFYDTPLGRSLMEKMPDVMQASARMGENWGMAVAQRAMPRVQAYLDSRD